MPSELLDIVSGERAESVIFAVVQRHVLAAVAVSIILSSPMRKIDLFNICICQY